MTFHHRDPGDECEVYQVCDLDTKDIPLIKDQHEPDTLETGAAPHSVGQPIKDVGSKQKAVPPKKRRKRTTSDAVPTGPGRHPKAKKPRKKKENVSRVPRPARVDTRRTKPDWLYFCLKEACDTSQAPTNKFRGFKSKEDAQRHLYRHEKAQYICPLSHRDDKAYAAKRSDHLRK